MQLDVKNLTFGAVGEKDEYILDQQNFKLAEDLVADSLKGKIKLTRLDESILVQVEGEAVIKVACDRCLTEYPLVLPFTLNQEYFLGGYRENEEDLLVSKHFEVDLSEPLSAEIILAIPVQKICRKDCKGLCSHCGADRNKKGCDCEPKVNKAIKFVK